MDMTLTLLGVSFSLFFILLSYWKEDKFLNVIGSISLFIMATILAGTGLQTESIAPTVTNVTFNGTSYIVSAQSPQAATQVWYESLGMGLMIAVFTAIQYLYFSMSFKESLS